MSRWRSLALAVDRAFEDRAAVLVFGGWENHGSVAALLGTLKIVALKGLRHTPLNFETGLVPAPWIDQAAFVSRTHRVARVARFRNEARTERRTAGTTLEGDLVNSDWDYAARVVSRNAPALRAPLLSFVPLDTIRPDGRVERAARPVLGQNVRRGEPRLPRFLAMRVRARSPLAVRTLGRCPLIVVDLRHARGGLTSHMVREVLVAIGTNRPALVLAEGGAELSAFGDTSVLAGISRSEALASLSRNIDFAVVSLSRSRVASEEQFRFALPRDAFTSSALELVELAVAAWRTSWRSLAPSAAENRALGQFRQALERLRRHSPTEAAHFALVEKVLSGEAHAFAEFARERTEAAASAVEELRRRHSNVLVIVGSNIDLVHMRALLHARGLLASTAVLSWRDQINSPVRAEACVVCAAYGPATLDAALRSHPEEICVVSDPIEGRMLAGSLHRQAEILNRAGQTAAAHVVGTADGRLASAFSGFASSSGDLHDGDFMSTTHSSPEGRYGSSATDHVPEIIDETGEVLVVFASGLRIRALSGRKLDVLGLGSPHARSVRVDQLEIGDQVLLVRGEQQRTLSELLIEDMDRQELREQADKRRAWTAIVRAVSASTHRSPAHVAETLRASGVNVSNVRIRSWLRADDEETTPRDVSTFFAFARAIGVPASDEVLSDFFQAIRGWRVAHRLRGRQIVRAMRLAWCGSLSAGALRSFQDRWGIAARDLVQGSRLEEVEQLIYLNDGVV